MKMNPTDSHESDSPKFALTQIPALHVVYRDIPIVETRTCSLYEYATGRNADQDRVKKLATAERKRIYDHVHKHLATSRLWQELRPKLELYIDPTVLNEWQESLSGKIAGQTIQHLFDIIGDRKNNPDDRLRWVIAKYGLENLEYLKEYIEFRSQHSMRDETGTLIQQLELRHDVQAALIRKKFSEHQSEILLCRIDFLVDAAVCRRERPQVYREWLRS